VCYVSVLITQGPDDDASPATTRPHVVYAASFFFSHRNNRERLDDITTLTPSSQPSDFRRWERPLPISPVVEAVFYERRLRVFSRDLPSGYVRFFPFPPRCSIKLILARGRSGRARSKEDGHVCFFLMLRSGDIYAEIFDFFFRWFCVQGCRSKPFDEMIFANPFFFFWFGPTRFSQDPFFDSFDLTPVFLPPQMRTLPESTFIVLSPLRSAFEFRFNLLSPLLNFSTDF